MLNNLFKKGKIGRLELKNRIVMAPMATYLADKEGYVTDALIDYFVARAEGGVALIDTQVATIVPEVMSPHYMGLHDDSYIPGLKRLTGAVHAAGAKIAQQLWHPGLWGEKVRRGPGGLLPQVGPSRLPFRYFLDESLPPIIELSRSDIARLIEAYGQAARRVCEAGFDAVEVHGAHGYLISSFLSPLTNLRTDEYGGSREKRARFAAEVIARVRKQVGRDFPILFRMDGDDYIEGGIRLEDTLCHAPLLVEAGTDAISLSAGIREGNSMRMLTYLHSPGALLHLAAAVKKRVKAPVIAAGKLGDPVFADCAIEQGKTDFVALGRALLADPEWPNKAKKGSLDDINRCLYCCLGCFHRRDRELYGSGINCTVNPALGRERKFIVKRARGAKKIMVIGGGLAGMEAAATLAERGHKVSLYEGSYRLGGQWNIASMEKAKREFARLTTRLTSRLKEAGVDIHLESKVTAKLVQSIGPDAVIVATGAIPAAPKIPGAELGNVVQAVDVIQGKAKVGEKPVIIGGRYVGMELALDLAEEGKKVCLVTRSGLGRDMAGSVRRTIRDRLFELGVQIVQNAPVTEIRDNGIRVWPKDDDLPMFIYGDTVVLAMGFTAEGRLLKQLKRLLPEVYGIGDCVEPRDAFAAIREGAEIGRRL